jgi:protein-S-isoprenylcysteine O-methyltransferase Ste14
MELSEADPSPARVHSDRLISWLLIAGSVVFSAGYVALTVTAWGWDDWRGFVLSMPRDTVCAGVVALFLGTFAFGCNVSTGRREHSGNNWIFPVMLLVGLAMGWFCGHDDRRNIHVFGSQSVADLGAILFLAGTVLRIAAVRTLGPRHSVWVAVQEGHRLVTTGLYRVVRHPSYVGALLAVFGWALAFRSEIGLALAVLIVPPILSRIRAEENLLNAEFGDLYQSYQRRTSRLLPFVY